jgi:hypothetical protein
MVAGARGIGAAHTARGQIYESVPVCPGPLVTCGLPFVLHFVGTIFGNALWKRSISLRSATFARVLVIY